MDSEYGRRGERRGIMRGEGKNVGKRERRGKETDFFLEWITRWERQKKGKKIDLTIVRCFHSLTQLPRVEITKALILWSKARKKFGVYNSLLLKSQILISFSESLRVSQRFFLFELSRTKSKSRGERAKKSGIGLHFVRDCAFLEGQDQKSKRETERTKKTLSVTTVIHH